MVAFLSEPGVRQPEHSAIDPEQLGRNDRNLNGPWNSNAEWARQRAERVAAHARRVAAELRRHSRGKLPGEATNGRRQAVWCVELRQEFESLSHAARFVGRAPSNILQAIRLGVRCGDYHWQRVGPISAPHAARLSLEVPTATAGRTGLRSTGRGWQRIIASLRLEADAFVLTQDPRAVLLIGPRPSSAA